MRRHPFVLQRDVRKYFPSIDHYQVRLVHNKLHKPAGSANGVRWIGHEVW